MHDAWIPLLLSLKVAGWATALDIVLGVAAAFGLARWRSPARDVVDSLLTLPLVLPPTVLPLRRNVVRKPANCCVFAFPRMIAPAARKRDRKSVV